MWKKKSFLQSMQELEDCMKSSRSISFSGREPTMRTAGGTLTGGTDRISDQTYRRVSDQSFGRPSIQRRSGRNTGAGKETRKIGRIVKKRRYWEDGLL